MKLIKLSFLFLMLCLTVGSGHSEIVQLLTVGTAGHAFDHLGNIGEQAETAVASGANILYVTGLGGVGYLGLPEAAELDRQKRDARDYLKLAKRQGTRLAIGYVCATSMVKLGTFDRNWPSELREQFRTPPAQWRQEDAQGRPLTSWYGGDYEPACMNNPDWRAYEKQIVRWQLEAGCDGIFFDNPTVHPQGCYCPHCMKRFAELLSTRDHTNQLNESVESLRAFARAHPREFLAFRATIAGNFLAEMRAYARRIDKQALITANNSLNSKEVLYSQCRTYGYSIYELSRAEDFVVVEDMSSQPRCLNGQAIEYGPTYRQLEGISHGKPVVAVCLADGDYHTPPNLVRLAMAEAAANGASHLWWPTWPEAERERTARIIAPEAQFLRANRSLLNDAPIRSDVLLFLPMRDFLDRNDCPGSAVAAELSRANIQFTVLCEDQLRSPFRGAEPRNRGASVLLLPPGASLLSNERQSLLSFIAAGGQILKADGNDWLKAVRQEITNPSVVVTGSSFIRAVVHDQPKRTVVHVLNLNLEKLTSFTDRVHPAENVDLKILVPRKKVRTVRALSADEAGTKGPLKFETTKVEGGVYVSTRVPRVNIAAILVLE